MDELLARYAADPKNANLNFELASKFKEIKHYAGACSYFLRCAEWANTGIDWLLVYESLIQISMCFRELGNRQWSEEGWLMHAISYVPRRPEAYWLLSMLYERQKKLQESYLFATLGLNCIDYWPEFKINIGWEGMYVLIFQKAVAAWWIGRYTESKDLFISIIETLNISDKYKQACLNNLNIINRL